jgi:hypothetical protein
MIKFSEWVIKEAIGRSITIGDVLLKIIKDTEWNEYIVQWIENGTLNDDKSYHTGGTEHEDLEDAIGTMRHMAQRESSRSGHPVTDL